MTGDPRLNRGELGLDDVDPDSSEEVKVPTQVRGLLEDRVVCAVSAGYFHTMAIAVQQHQ